MEYQRTPLAAILGPIIGAILLFVVVNMGVNYLRQGQIELKEEARREQAASKFGNVEEDAAAPESESDTANSETVPEPAAETDTLSDTVPAAQEITATDTLSATASDTITEAVSDTGIVSDSIQAAQEITATDILSAAIRETITSTGAVTATETVTP